MFSIKSKIIFAYTSLFGILLIIFAVIIYQSTKQNSIERLDANLLSYSNIIQSEMEEELNENFKLNSDEIKSISSQGMYDVRIQLFDKAKGKLISDSLLSKDNSIKNFLNLKTNKFITLEFDGKKYRSLISPAEEDMNTNFVLQTAASLKNVDTDLNRLLLIFFIVIPFALLITGLTAYYISKRAFIPITFMVETANKISINSLDKRLKTPNKKDEIFLLGQTLNNMIERIDDAVKSQKQFIADASHEIKTPLTIIQTELELALKKLNDLSIKENIDIALSEVERLNGLVKSLLTLVKLESLNDVLNIQNIRLDELLIDCFRSMKKTADENSVQFTISITDPVEIMGDEEKLKSIFINLIDNGIKYSGKCGIVSIDLKKGNKNAVQISISDNGPGMRENEIENMFKRFYRSSEVRSDIIGSGLGLSIAKKLVELHNGTIAVRSSLGNGSQFIVTLPLTFSSYLRIKSTS